MSGVVSEDKGEVLFYVFQHLFLLIVLMRLQFFYVCMSAIVNMPLCRVIV